MWVSGKMSIEKGLGLWTILSRSFFEFLMCVIEELWKSKLVIMFKMYYREREQILQISLEVNYQAGQGAAED